MVISRVTITEVLSAIRKTERHVKTGQVNIHKNITEPLKTTPTADSGIIIIVVTQIMIRRAPGAIPPIHASDGITATAVCTKSQHHIISDS